MSEKPPTPCRQVRNALGLTQQELASLLGVAKQTVVDIEGRRNAYSAKISWDMARGIALVSGAHPGSLIDQYGTARVSDAELESGETYSEKHAQLWKSARHDRSYQEDGPSPVIDTAIWTIASALVAADKQGPMRADLLWNELLRAIEDLRVPAEVYTTQGHRPPPPKEAFSLDANMRKHSKLRRQLQTKEPSVNLDLIAPLSLLLFLEKDTGGQMLLLTNILRTVSELAKPHLTSGESDTLAKVADQLRKRGLNALKAAPKRKSASQPRSAKTAKARRTPSAPKRRR